MKQSASILIVVLACASCGYVVRHQIHFAEIDRPVTTEEIMGRWEMWTNKLDYAIAAGFKPQTNQEFAITIRSDRSCSYRGLKHHGEERPVYVELDGQWSLRYYGPTNYHRNFLELSVKDRGGPEFYIGRGDKGVMVLYEYWGDPDDAKYIVYQKGESTAPAPNPKQLQH